MSMITVTEAAENWGISVQLVRRYCREKRIPNAIMHDGVWFIPSNASRPDREEAETVTTPPLLKKLIRQRNSTYAGLYDYLQINMSYSSNRMASNRLTRNHVEFLFKKGKILTTNENLTAMCQEYEKLRTVTLQDILDLHVQFENIHPFDDGNGRIGRLLMLKECLRHGITPFILDDKRRSAYLEGIRCWEKDPLPLTQVCMEAQLKKQFYQYPAATRYDTESPLLSF